MKSYLLSITKLAQKDLQDAKSFYDEQAENLGDYFIDSLFVDLDSLQFYAGIHEQHLGYYKMLAKRFPYTIYYDIENEFVIVHAILDSRKNPLNIETRLD